MWTTDNSSRSGRHVFLSLLLGRNRRGWGCRLKGAVCQTVGSSGHILDVVHLLTPALPSFPLNYGGPYASKWCRQPRACGALRLMLSFQWKCQLQPFVFLLQKTWSHCHFLCWHCCPLEACISTAASWPVASCSDVFFTWHLTSCFIIQSLSLFNPWRTLANVEENLFFIRWLTGI